MNTNCSTAALTWAQNGKLFLLMAQSDWCTVTILESTLPASKKTLLQQKLPTVIFLAEAVLTYYLVICFNSLW